MRRQLLHREAGDDRHLGEISQLLIFVTGNSANLVNQPLSVGMPAGEGSKIVQIWDEFPNKEQSTKYWSLKTNSVSWNRLALQNMTETYFRPWTADIHNRLAVFIVIIIRLLQIQKASKIFNGLGWVQLCTELIRTLILCDTGELVVFILHW